MLTTDADKLLASDLDGTLIPPEHLEDDGGLAALREALASRQDVAVAYVTGRTRSSALRGMARFELPAPEILVCDVGTSVFVARDGAYVPDPEYRDLMVAALGGAEHGSARRALEALADLVLQPDDQQTELKLSYYIPADERGDDLAARVSELLVEVGRFNVVHSVDPVSGRGLLDVLPAGVAKDSALRYLHDRSGLHEDALVYAGDSGNDVAAMLSGFNVVVVGNASDALKAHVRSEAAARGLRERVYVADAAFAAGVLEGCRRFALL